jgi:hypothetical protein
MRIKIVLDCSDLDIQAAFWCAAAGYTRLDQWSAGYASLRASEDAGPDLLLQRVPESKAGKNRLHLDLHPDDGPGTVDRLHSLGAAMIGSVNTEFEQSTHTYFQVMADPEGNEFCVVWRSSPAAWD